MLIKQSGGAYHHAVIDDILLLISQALAFHLVLQIFEEKNRSKWYTYFTNTVKDQGSTIADVLEEKTKVEEHMKHYEETASLPSHVALVVQNLKKTYGKETILKGVNFNIYRQECFGLLGFNGAGKSSIFKTLTGQGRMSHGKAVMFDYEFARHQDNFIGMIGYCPQTGGLSDFMTGRQHLQLHAALRGVPLQNITDETNKWLDVLDLLDFENMKIKHCPWGVQRKICILQSLIGDLPMIFMDEPSSGIDIMSRHAICDMLHQVQEMGRSLLFTTHNMQEAEAMCLRVGILVDGQFVAIGSCEQFKEKHGSNFVMSIGIAPGFRVENVEVVKRLIDETFPGIKFKDSHLGVLKYELGRDIPYSNIFDELDKLRKKYPWITDFSINQPSMDQVFLDMAKKQKQSPQKLPSCNRICLWIRRLIRQK
ncbi:hypothetical protein KM043_014258 [Ampulex compressa]|nr:hypothetical protein KM043_014258 [Ampulex compressa]